MKYLGAIQDPKDLTTKEYVDDADAALSTRINTNEDNIALAETDIESLQGDVNTLKTDNTSIKAAVQTLQDTYVPNTRKVNSKPLNADITLSASDVGALENTYKSTFIVNVNTISTGLSADKTFEEITNAYNSGYGVYCLYGNFYLLYLKLITSSGIQFSGSTFSGNSLQSRVTWFTLTVSSSNKWNVQSSDAVVIPTKTSQLTNDSGFLTSAPVTSVNNKTGAVALTASDVGALPTTGGTLTGNLKVGSASLGTNGYVQGTLLQGTAANHMTTAATKIAVQDGSGWIYHRTTEELRTDIGAAKTLTYSVKTKTSWTNSSGYYQQTIAVSGMLSTDNPIIDIIPSLNNYASELEAWNKVITITTNNDSITIFSSEAISIVLTLNIKVVR